MLSGKWWIYQIMYTGDVPNKNTPNKNLKRADWLIFLSQINWGVRPIRTRPIRTFRPNKNSPHKNFCILQNAHWTFFFIFYHCIAYFEKILFMFQRLKIRKLISLAWVAKRKFQENLSKYLERFRSLSISP